MAWAAIAIYAGLIDKLQIGLMSECGSIQRMMCTVAPELTLRNGAQLIVDQRCQLIHHLTITTAQLGQKLGDLFRIGKHSLIVLVT